jgi:AraC-like DNA-binding protein
MYFCDTTSSRLHRITDWEARAWKAGYKAQVMASHASVSVRHLRRYFSNFIGLSPQSFINRVRLEKAQRLLADGESVKGVAISLGYKQSSHFSAVFKRAYGTSPSACRLAQAA